MKTPEFVLVLFLLLGVALGLAVAKLWGWTGAAEPRLGADCELLVQMQELGHPVNMSEAIRCHLDARQEEDSETLAD